MSSSSPNTAPPSPVLAELSDTLVGIDTGGTFTDFVLVDSTGIRTAKVPSTPADPSQAILQGLSDLGLDNELAAGRLRIVHGSTVATNALLEGKLARTLYVGNRGFEDLLVLGRQARRSLYDLTPEPEPDLVPAELRVGTGGRVAATGEMLEPLTDGDLDALEATARERGVEAVAINLLFSYRDDRAERRIAERLGRQFVVSRSSAVLPEYREYERGVATFINAGLSPVVGSYLRRFAAATRGNGVAVMMSSGGTVAAELAAERAVTLLLSGPAGGVVAAARCATMFGRKRLLTFDMGGTSTDVARVDGELQLSGEGMLNGLPIAIPMIDMHSIGAGGGSIASIDEGGVLQVGPQSAGADPGPACYGRGGTAPTVTDANLLLGRLPAAGFLGGTMTLDVDAAQRSLAPLADALGLSAVATAEGVVAIATEHMANALRMISVERGFDPREATLCCFGGAGGLHVCALADALEIKEVLLPPASSVFSALGMLLASPSRELTRAIHALLPRAATTIAEVVRSLRNEGAADLEREGVEAAAVNAQASLDLRYRGQSFTLSLPWTDAPSPTGDDLIDAFHSAHEARYGHRVATPVELVNVRLRLTAPPPLGAIPDTSVARSPAGEEVKQTTLGVPIRPRADIVHPLAGPVLITEPLTCTWVGVGWRVAPGARGELWLRRDQEEAATT